MSLKDSKECTTTNSLPQMPIPPTWISTPPTPPPRIVRRSTCLTRPVPPLLSSASFPASIHPHDNGCFVKRCASMPVMSQQQHLPPDAVFDTIRPRGRDDDRVSPVIASPLQATVVALPSDTTTGETRSKPIFHISPDTLTDTEDTDPRVMANPEHAEEMSAEGSWSDNDSDDFWHSEKVKDDIRKYHALKELLATEVGYLLDLRALVTVYLRILPTLVPRISLGTTFSRASSFTSSPWINSYSHAYAATVSSAMLPDPSVPHPPTLTQAKEYTKSLPRYLFSDREVETLTRNAEEMLQLHESFLRELQVEMTSLGFQMGEDKQEDLEKCRKEELQNIDAAIRVISTKFATEASRFASYQVFCIGHLEALDLVRKVHSQYPLEWDAFEQRCASLIHQSEPSLSPASAASEKVILDEFDVTLAMTKNRTRTASESLNDNVTLHRRASNLSPRSTVSFPDDTTHKDKNAPRLTFVDYLIKPVQRICKYPLIFDQLKTGKVTQAISPVHSRSDVDIVVENAAQAMRHVASAVDEARHRQDVAIQSSLIISRISLTSPTLIHILSTCSGFQPFTPSFLSSLGNCLLAGSLDVIYYHTVKPASSSISAKYLGAFLYSGGYLILVKVSKGKTYEPKHWFPLVDFDIHDTADDAMLPCSIRLSSKDHQFELAAACQREKDAWLNSIHESRHHQSSWVNEPTSSLRFDGKGELIPETLGDGPSELTNASPTIYPIPELVNKPERPEFREPLPTNLILDVKQMRPLKHDLTAWKQLQDADPPSRRSSTASVKAIFSPISSDSETIVIRRFSASARSRVDQGLQDVISQLCLTARAHASVHEEELFQAPKSIQMGFIRSQTGLSMAGMAKGRLTRHESVRVRRRRSLVDGLDATSPKKSTTKSPLPVIKGQSANLSIECDVGIPASHLSAPFSATSMSSSTQASLPTSPIHNSPTTPLKCSNILPEVKISLKTSLSLVSNVKGFFVLRSPSLPNPEQAPQPARTRTSGSIRCWVRGTLHRRSRSAPDIPEEPFTLPEIQKLPALDLGASISFSESQFPRRPPSDRSPPKSLFSPPIYYTTPVEIDHNHNITKHVPLLQRLKA